MTQSKSTVRKTFLLCAVPPAIALALAVIYWLWRDFYLAYILERSRREFQAVELATVVAGFIGFLLLVAVSVMALRRRMMMNAAVAGVVAMATLFFVGEEISWGQTYFKWKTPREFRQYSHETNVHNTDLPVHTAANAFIVSLFFVLPLAWFFREQTRLPLTLEPVVPTAPVIAWAATGFIWKETKQIHRALRGDDSDAGWHAFFDQINEQKEMFIALALMHYGWACATRMRRTARISAGGL